MKRNAGFTLIELVIVIIVLGILAATAVPKFINLQDDAKESAMAGVEASLHSAANLVYSKAAIDGVETLGNQQVSAAGTTVNVDFGYPEASTAGIGAAIELSGFSSATSNSVVTFWFGDASVATGTCVTYTEATSSAIYSVGNAACS